MEILAAPDAAADALSPSQPAAVQPSAITT